MKSMDKETKHTQMIDIDLLSSLGKVIVEQKFVWLQNFKYMYYHEDTENEEETINID